MKENQRIDWIDIAKGIGIILVVLGHMVVKTDYIHKFIFSFHMPLFFVLSGYCFPVGKYRTVKEVLQKRSRALLLPYCKFVLVGLCVTLLIPEWREALTVDGLLTDLYLGYPSSVHVTSIWYLISLCGITVIYFILYAWSQKTGKKFILYLGLALSGAAGYCIYLVKGLAGVGDNRAEAAAVISLPGGRLPLTVDASLMALIFFAVGVWCCQRDVLSRLKNKGILATAGLVLTVAVGCFFNTRVNIHGCSYGNIVCFFIAAMSGTIMVICVAQMIGAGAGKPVTGWKRILIFFGKNSLFMFAMQSLFVHLYVYVINKCTQREYVLYENVPFLYGMIGFGLITVLCLPISYWVVWKCKKFVVRKNG